MNQSNNTVAIYHRVANANSESDLEITRSITQMLNYANKQDYNQCAVFVDLGFSAHNCERPAFRTMEKQLHSGDFGLLLVNDYARIARNPFECEKWMQKVIDYGVEVRIASNGFINHVPFSLAYFNTLEKAMRGART